MSPKLRFQIMLEPHQLDALRDLEERTGAPIAESIRRAIDLYLKEQGAPTRPTAATKARARRAK